MRSQEDKVPIAILLVEDDPDDINIVRVMLGPANAALFELEYADRLSTALTRLSARDFTLVLLDLSLPDCKGLATLDRIRAHAPQVPIIVLTGTQDETLAVQSVQRGAQDYVFKGDVARDLLVRSIRAAIERKRIEEELCRARDELELRVQARTAELTKTLAALRKESAERLREEQESRRLQTKMQQSQKLESLGVLAGGIAHDFNNLLTVILGNAGLAYKALPEDSSARGSIREIETASLRAAELVQQMLAYSGKGHFVLQSVNLSRVAEDMSRLLHTVISKKVVLHFDCASDLPNIDGDPSQIRQVILNLITNASESVGEKNGVITLRTGVRHAEREDLAAPFNLPDLPEGDYVSLEVIDTGCGMDAATLDKIFDPFFSTKFTGRGLGLAAVLGIVRSHRGAIKIRSELQRGTTFTVQFPICNLGKEDGGNGRGLPQRGIGPWRGTGTLLVVDDDAQVLALASQILESNGFRVLQAADGKAGLDELREHQEEIAGVLLDLTMPNLDGEETFREMRRVRPDLRVVLMSGYHDQEVAALFAGKGLAGFLQKPFRASELLAVMRRMLEKSTTPGCSELLPAEKQVG